MFRFGGRRRRPVGSLVLSLAAVLAVTVWTAALASGGAAKTTSRDARAAAHARGAGDPGTATPIKHVIVII
ncbi:MAG: hypothetical protein JO325_04435, partial [Solirubrobacterales bacterium]|nr:hypothetical protein [Solirubrobacterales bacterium]